MRYWKIKTIIQDKHKTLVRWDLLISDSPPEDENAQLIEKYEFMAELVAMKQTDILTTDEYTALIIEAKKH